MILQTTQIIVRRKDKTEYIRIGNLSPEEMEKELARHGVFEMKTDKGEKLVRTVLDDNIALVGALYPETAP